MPVPGIDTTTLSTVVLQQANDNRIVVALLKSGDRVHLKLLEMTPDMGYLGTDFEESTRLQKGHADLLQQLHSKQSPVEELLRQADQLIVNQRPKAGVYAAMAKSLGAAWEDLHRIIDLRHSIVNANFLCQGHIQDFTAKADQLEALVLGQAKGSHYQVKEMASQKKRMLEAASFALQEGDSLLARLHQAWSETVPGVTPPETRASLSRAIETVELWMESVHEKRCRATSRLMELQQLWKKALADSPLDLGHSVLSVEEAISRLQRLFPCREVRERIHMLEEARRFFCLAEAGQVEESRIKGQSILDRAHSADFLVNTSGIIEKYCYFSLTQ